MHNDINIQELVNEIWSPDIEDTLPKAVDFSEDSRYLFMLAFLVYNVKECVDKNMYSPYIQIKSNTGKLLFNDRLYIDATHYHKPQNYTYLEYEIDFINDQSTTHSMHCSTNERENDDDLTTFATADFGKPIAQINDKDYLNAVNSIIKQMRKDKPPRKLAISFDLATHHYNPKTKTWVITSPLYKDLFN